MMSFATSKKKDASFSFLTLSFSFVSFFCSMFLLKLLTTQKYNKTITFQRKRNKNKPNSNKIYSCLGFKALVIFASIFISRSLYFASSGNLSIAAKQTLFSFS